MEPDKAARWSAELRTLLVVRHWSSQEARQWAGRLQWATSVVWGRVGRAYLRPLYWFGEEGSSGARLTKRHTVCLEWWLRMLETSQFREIPWDQEVEGAPPTFLVFTDAEGSGGAGVTVIPLAEDADPKEYFSIANVPRKWKRKMTHRKAQINAYEQAAVLLALGTFPDLLRGQRVLFFIDSNAALGTVLKGHNRRDDLNLFAGTTWHLLADLHIEAHFLRVPSKQNPADAPSRCSVEPARKAALRARPHTLERRPRWPKTARGLLQTVGATLKKGVRFCARGK